MSRRPARNRPPPQSSSIISGMAQPLNGVFKMSMGLRPASRGSAPFDQGAMDEQYATAQPRHLVRCSFQIIALFNEALCRWFHSEGCEDHPKFRRVSNERVLDQQSD